MPSIVNFFLSLAVFGAFCYIITLIPMPPFFKQVIYVLMCLAFLFIVAGFFGYGPAHGYYVK